jgi:hypothetical protein
MELVQLFNQSAPLSAAEALKALEAEWGEPVLYCSTGRFLAAQGLGTVPIDSWGLMALTPTRLMFRHYSQSHPLFGLKDQETNWSGTRAQFTSCVPVIPKFWDRLFSRTPDHVALDGGEAQLLVEVADDPRKFVQTWTSSVGSP